MIFSTNYDSAVESICDQQNISYVDGFIRKEKEEYPRFDPSSFDAAKNSIRLYKLHGSINWWSNDSRQIIFKLSLELSGVPGVKNLMIYLAQKEDVLAFPYNVLESALMIQLHRTNELIAIGHKFGNANIASAVRVALERPDFKLILVNPEADIIKKTVFKDNARVVAVNKGIEEWVRDDFSSLKVHEKVPEQGRLSKILWSVESFHRYTDTSMHSMYPRTMRECTLACPSCGNNQELRTPASRGDLMCESCKEVVEYSLPG